MAQVYLGHEGVEKVRQFEIRFVRGEKNVERHVSQAIRWLSKPVSGTGKIVLVFTSLNIAASFLDHSGKKNSGFE